MGKIIVVNFEQGRTEASAYDKVWQYDYGQTLRIQGLKLPRIVEIHFATQRTGGIAIPRMGVTRDGVTDVVIPDSMLENGDATSDYPIYAFVYLTDETSGQTEYMIRMQVKSRPRPEVPGGSEDPGAFHEAVQEVRKLTEKAAESERQAEGWAHGREDLPERNEDNAKYYAGKASEDAKKTAADRTAVESVVQDVTQMQGDVAKDLEQVQKFTEQAQTSATNAALSEQAAKTSETNAQTAQAGAETAEAHAELAEQGAKTSEQAVEKAKQLVTQMGQEVLDNKNHVDQVVHDFDLTTQQALADVNNAGQTQTERVQGAGETAVENIQTAQTVATKAVETAKTEAVESVQTEGTAQTGNVTKEGEKQVQAVQQAAQEIVADREQIQQNKAGIEALKQSKADAIVDSASGENITLTDSAEAPLRGLRIFGKSTQDGTPTPENPVPIANVGVKGTIDVGVTGKNLFDENLLLKNGGIKQPDGSIYIAHKDIVVLENAKKEDIGQLCMSYSIKSLENKNSFVFYIKYTDNTESYIGRTASNTFRKQQGTTDGSKTISSIKIVFGELGNHYVKDIQIEKGSVATAYEPYHTPQSLALATPNGLPGIKVDSGGNYTDSNGQQWSCDEIDLGRGKYVQRIVNTVLNSRLGELNVGVHDNGTRYLSVLLKVRPKTNSLNMCERYKGNDVWTDKNEYVYIPSNRSIIITDNRFTDIDSAKRIIDAEQAKLLYIMETPIEHDLTPEEITAYKALHTNYPTTVISNDESTHMEVSYVADTKNYIAKVNAPLQKQIIDLQNALISQKISGGGIKVTDSARVPVVNFAMWGKTEQVKTTGAQLIPTQEKNATTYGITLSISNDIWHIEGTATGNGGRLILCTDPFELGAGTYTIEHDHLEAVYMSESDSGKVLGDKKIILSGKTTIVIGVNVRLGTRYNNGFKVMLCKGEEPLPWEPYSGGKPSPSPEYPQSIEVTDKPVTVTIKGGTEQQSITLVPPRPLTKWDKLEKIDGVWQWVYKSGTATLKGDAEEYWKKNATKNPEKYRFFPDILKNKIKNCENNKIADIYCTSYIAVSANDTYTASKNGVSIQSDGTLFIYDEKHATGSIADFTKALAKNPITVYYEAIDTEYIPLPQPAQDKLNALTMYAPTTEITNDGGCTMELTYTVDTKSYVDTKIAEISKAII